MAGSGRGTSASWLPVLMATCGVPETRRPSCLLQQRSFNWCQFCGPAVRSESPARESPAAPAWGSPGGRHWLVGGAAGNELVSNGSSLLHELSLPPAGQPGWVSRPLHPRWVGGRRRLPGAQTESSRDVASIVFCWSRQVARPAQGREMWE